MKTSAARDLIVRLDGIRDELIDLAFTLERRGNPEAADVAHTIRARMDELRGEFIEPCPDLVGLFVE
jgi:hypothetical protein